MGGLNNQRTTRASPLRRIHRPQPAARGVLPVGFVTLCAERGSELCFRLLGQGGPLLGALLGRERPIRAELVAAFGDGRLQLPDLERDFRWLAQALDEPTGLLEIAIARSLVIGEAGLAQRHANAFVELTLGGVARPLFRACERAILLRTELMIEFLAQLEERAEFVLGRIEDRER